MPFSGGGVDHAKDGKRETGEYSSHAAVPVRVPRRECAIVSGEKGAV
jgi:hypothetical protein